MKIPKRRKAPRLRESTEDALQRFAEVAPQFYEELRAPAIEAGHLIRGARKAANLTQIELATATGLPQSAISDLERGVGVDGPTYRTLSNIGKVLGQRLTFVPGTGAKEIIRPQAVGTFDSGSPPEENGVYSTGLEGRKFLLASEDFALTSRVAKLLDNLGCEVVCHRSGNEAIRSIKEIVFDAILIDVAVSHPDYEETCRVMRDEGVTSPIMLLSAAEKSTSSTIDISKLGASGWLSGTAQFTNLPMKLGKLLTHC